MSLYDRVLDVARPSLAGSTERFMERQCRAHLGIAPEEISAQHLPELARWTEISAALLIRREDAKALRRKIEALV